jgi:tRNA dimethylallyltransferase
VGGTHYYIQSLLVNESTIPRVGSDEIEHAPIPFLQEPTDVLVEKLREVDPIMADRWHPNERRKIQRSLEIWFQTGKPASELYAAQGTGSSSIDDQTDSKSGLRFDEVVFWVNTPKDILQNRLDGRVDTMLEAGLIDEVKTLSAFQAQKRAEGHAVDMSKGIGVAIGYKEFLDYTSAAESGLSEDKIKSLHGEAIEKTKISTRQYANKQLKWIRNKLLPALDREGGLDHVYVLHNTEASKFEAEVEKTAQQLTEKFLNGDEIPASESLSQEASELLASKGSDLSKQRSEWMKRTCEICNVTTVTKRLWDEHEQSNRHRRAVSAVARRKRLEAEGRLGPPS